MKLRAFIALFIAACLMSIVMPTQSVEQTLTAALVIVNAPVRTIDKAQPAAEAVAPLPTKELIDKVTPDHPVFINRLDGHMALANSLALKLAGVTGETKDPPGGLIVRDPQTNEPTGVLKDAAMGLVDAKIPAHSL